MTSAQQTGLTASEEMLARTFDTWRKEFRTILEDHRREIQDRLEKIEREIEKKSDKETVDILVKSITADLQRHSEEIDRLQIRVNSKVGTETLWKIIGFTLTAGSAIGGLIAYLAGLASGAKP